MEYEGEQIGALFCAIDKKKVWLGKSVYVPQSTYFDEVNKIKKQNEICGTRNKEEHKYKI